MLLEAGEQAQLTAYLLDRLPESEARRIEERYFSDDAFFILAGACEQELIRDYLLQKLAPDDVRRFERKYLSSPGLREKVEFSAAIMTVTRALPARERARTGIRRVPLPWLAAAAALAFALIAWQQIRIARMEARLEQWMAGAAVKVAGGAPARSIPAFALRLAPERDARSAPLVLRIPADAEKVQLSAEIEPGNEAAGYRAALALPAGAEVWSGFVPGGSPLVTITVPAQSLPRGDYVLTLDARTGAAHEAYAFRVERE